MTHSSLCELVARSIPSANNLCDHVPRLAFGQNRSRCSAPWDAAAEKRVTVAALFDVEPRKAAVLALAHQRNFTFNCRQITDGERAALDLKGAEGKRRSYRRPHQTQNSWRDALCAGEFGNLKK
jgi:hypothetical protein